MLEPPITPNLYEQQVAGALLRICTNEPRFVHYLPRELAEVISFFGYVDPEADGQAVERAQVMLEGWEAA